MSFEGVVLNIWYDDYNWHENLSVLIPFEGSVSDQLGNILIKEGLGSTFRMETKWKEDVKGRYEKSFFGGNITMEITKSGIHNYNLNELKQIKEEY